MPLFGHKHDNNTQPQAGTAANPVAPGTAGQTQQHGLFNRQGDTSPSSAATGSPAVGGSTMTHSLPTSAGVAGATAATMTHALPGANTHTTPGHSTHGTPAMSQGTPGTTHNTLGTAGMTHSTHGSPAMGQGMHGSPALGQSTHGSTGLTHGTHGTHAGTAGLMSGSSTHTSPETSPTHGKDHRSLLQRLTGSHGSNDSSHISDPRIAAARDRVIKAEEAERNAHNAWKQAQVAEANANKSHLEAQAAARQARDQVDKLEKDLAEELRLARLKEEQLREVSQRSDALGTH